MRMLGFRYLRAARKLLLSPSVVSGATQDRRKHVPPPTPDDLALRKAVDMLAAFVAGSGSHRQR